MIEPIRPLDETTIHKTNKVTPQAKLPPDETKVHKINKVTALANKNKNVTKIEQEKQPNTVEIINNKTTPGPNKRKRQPNDIDTEQLQSPKTPRIESKIKNELANNSPVSRIRKRVLFHENEIIKNSPMPKHTAKPKNQASKPNSNIQITKYFQAHKWPPDKKE